MKAVSADAFAAAGCSAETEALRLENAELRHQLAEVTGQLRRQETAVATFRAAASHDLISPVQTIRAFSRLLQRETDPSDRRTHEYLDFILQGADRMRLLVQGLLDHTQVTLRVPRRAPVDIGAAISRAISRLGPMVEDCDATFEVAEMPVIEADAALVERLFHGLIDNAVKYRSAAPPRIRIDHQSDDGQDMFTVTDNGIGLDMEFADAIFEPLRRLHGPMDRAGAGAGLGLATCREIARLLGGDVQVVRSDESGSCFRVILPWRSMGPV